MVEWIGPKGYISAESEDDRPEDDMPGTARYSSNACVLIRLGLLYGCIKY